MPGEDDGDCPRGQLPYQYFCTKPSEQGSFFLASWNESKQWYATIKTYKNINISAQYQYFCMKLSEQGSFFSASRNESKEWYAMIKSRYILWWSEVPTD